MLCVLAFTSYVARRPTVLRAVDETHIITCGKCQAVYPMTRRILGNGIKVQCEICGNVWYQTAKRLNSVYSHFELVPYPEEMKALWTGVNGERKRREGAVVLFVANLPYNCAERDISDFFAYRGVADPITQLARSPDGRSRGFAFVEVVSQRDAEKAIDDLDGVKFRGRPIVVRLSDSQQNTKSE